MRSRLFYIILMLVFPLLFISCEDDSANNDVVTIEPNIETVSEEAQIVIGTTLDLTADAIAGYDERAEAEASGSLDKTAGGTLTYENGWWVWENIVSFGEFDGHYLRKCQFRSTENGPAVERPSRADFMISEVSAEGTYGYPDNDPKYGVTFNNWVNLQVKGMNSSVRIIEGAAHIEKNSTVVYNGEDAYLHYAVDVNLDKLTWIKTRVRETVILEGKMTVTMDLWHAVVNCDVDASNPYADVVVYYDMNEDGVWDDSEVENEFKYDTRNFRDKNLIDGLNKFVR